MKLKQIADQVFYIENPVNIGVIQAKGNSAILIDSGLDDSAAKQILQVLSEAGLQPAAIINTHSHADHIGGNRFFQQACGAKIYAPEIEECFVRHPHLEPFFLFSGASPISQLENKFLQAQPSMVNQVIQKDCRSISIGGAEIGILPLPGHSINQIGLIFNDVLFCGDALFSKELIAKHKMVFCTDTCHLIQTLNEIKESKFSCYVPSHAEPSASIRELAEENLRHIEEIQRIILSFLNEPLSDGKLLSKIAAELSISIKSEQQYYLLHTTMLAHLSFLEKRKLAKPLIEKGYLLWKKAWKLHQATDRTFPFDNSRGEA